MDKPIDITGMILIQPPKKCPACKTKDKDLKEKHGRGFVYFGIPNSPLHFFQCPKCHCLVGNTNIVPLIKKMQEKPKIVQAKSPLILPGNPKMN